MAPKGFTLECDEPMCWDAGDTVTWNPSTEHELNITMFNDLGDTMATAAKTGSDVATLSWVRAQ